MCPPKQFSAKVIQFLEHLGLLKNKAVKAPEHYDEIILRFFLKGCAKVKIPSQAKKK